MGKLEIKERKDGMTPDMFDWRFLIFDRGTGAPGVAYGSGEKSADCQRLEATGSHKSTYGHISSHKKGKNYFWKRRGSAGKNPGVLILRSIFMEHLNTTIADGSEARCFIRFDRNHLRGLPKGRSSDLIFSRRILHRAATAGVSQFGKVAILALLNGLER